MHNPQQFEQTVQRPQHSDAAHHPLAKEAASCWSPENAKAFTPAQNNATEKSFGTNDDAMNAFFAQNLRDGVRCMPQPETTTEARHIREFNRGTQGLDKSTGNLNDALKSINCKNVDGAVRDINRALRNVDGGTKDLKDGMAATRGQTAAKGEIKDGINKVGYGKKEMQDALELLKEGKLDEATEAIKNALDNVNNGKKEVGYGVKDISNYKPTKPGQEGHNSNSETKPETKPEHKPSKPEQCEEPAKHPVKPHMDELRDSGRHFKNTKESLDKALLYLVSGDTSKATKTLGYSLEEVAEGRKDLKWGATGNDPLGIPNGDVNAGKYFDRSARDAADTENGIVDVLALLKQGETKQAEEALIKSIKSAIGARQYVGKGYDSLKG